MVDGFDNHPNLSDCDNQQDIEGNYVTQFTELAAAKITSCVEKARFATFGTTLATAGHRCDGVT